MRVRDSQRSAVYEWERKAIKDFAPLLKRQCAKQEAQALVEKVWREQAARVGQRITRPPSLRFRSRSGLCSFYYRHKHQIAISGTSVWLILHELAHSLNCDNVAPHGARYMAIYIMLLTTYGGANNAQLRALALSAGLKVFDRFHVAAQLSATIKNFLPGTLMDLAVSAGVSYRAVQGALIGPIRRGEILRRGQVYRSTP